MRPPEEVKKVLVGQWLANAEQDLKAGEALLAIEPPYSPGENGHLFKKLTNFVGLAFTCQLENVMRRVTPGEPNKYSAF
jgi:hypothetical protein